MSALATSDQVRAIKAAQRRHGIEDPDYRAALRAFGVVSCKDLTVGQAGVFLDNLNSGRSRFARSSKNRATGRYADILQALWIAAWNLGIVRDPDDAALLAFVKRQTKADHTRFLRDPRDTRRVIEAIKAMLVRGGVVWPKGQLGTDPVARKRAIVAAQLIILGRCGAAVPPAAIDLADTYARGLAGGSELDALSRHLGVAVRRARQTHHQGAK